MIKTIFFKYQAAMFYVSQTANEYNKILGFANNISVVVILLSTNFGIRLNFSQILMLYAGLMIACYLLGRFLVKVGVLEYMNQLNNKNNKEIREIHEDIKLIKKHLNIE